MILLFLYKDFTIVTRSRNVGQSKLVVSVVAVCLVEEFEGSARSWQASVYINLSKYCSHPVLKRPETVHSLFLLYMPQKWNHYIAGVNKEWIFLAKMAFSPGGQFLCSFKILHCGQRNLYMLKQSPSKCTTYPRHWMKCSEEVSSCDFGEWLCYLKKLGFPHFIQWISKEFHFRGCSESLFKWDHNWKGHRAINPVPCQRIQSPPIIPFPTWWTRTICWANDTPP